MQRGEESLKGSTVEALKRKKRRDRVRFNVSTLQGFNAFALYEVLLGVTIFAIGVVALGRAVENCLNASALSAEESRVREVLWNRMAEIQTTPGNPDVSKQTKIDSGYGKIVLIQKTTPANLTESDGNRLTGVNLVTLTAKWEKGGVTQSKQIEFYVYRPG
jgi:hypothetical protein